MKIVKAVQDVIGAAAALILANHGVPFDHTYNYYEASRLSSAYVIGWLQAKVDA